MNSHRIHRQIAGRHAKGERYDPALAVQTEVDRPATDGVLDMHRFERYKFYSDRTIVGGTRFGVAPSLLEDLRMFEPRALRHIVPHRIVKFDIDAEIAGIDFEAVTGPQSARFVHRRFQLGNGTIHG